MYHCPNYDLDTFTIFMIMYASCTHRKSLLNLQKHMVRKFVHPILDQHHLHQNLHRANHCRQLREKTNKLTNERPYKWICIYGNELYHRYKCAVKVGTRARASERPYKKDRYSTNPIGPANIPNLTSEIEAVLQVASSRNVWMSMNSRLSYWQRKDHLFNCW